MIGRKLSPANMNQMLLSTHSTPPLLSPLPQSAGSLPRAPFLGDTGMLFSYYLLGARAPNFTPQSYEITFLHKIYRLSLRPPAPASSEPDSRLN